MKKTSTVLLIITIASYAYSWEKVHTFSNNATYRQIVFDGSKYFLYEGIDSEVQTSTNLLDWTSLSQSFDLSLLEGEVSWVNVVSIGSSNLVCLIKDSTSTGGLYPLISSQIISLISSNGFDWVCPTIVSQGPFLNMQTTVMNNELYILDPLGSFVFKSSVYHYNKAQNNWSSIWSTTPPIHSPSAMGPPVFLNNNTNLYVSGTEGTICFREGITPDLMGDVSTGEAVAWNDLILSPEGWSYSPGAGWEYNGEDGFFLPTIHNLIFNGNRMAATVQDHLIYSDDFGRTWQSNYIENVSFSSTTIIEADQKYVALISTSTNSSIYTLDAYPIRATVTEIQGFGTASEGLNFQSTSNGLYQLESTGNLLNPDWKAFGLPKVGTGENITIDPSENLTSNIFFRVRAINN